jgi:hypothetical protein
MPTVTFDNDECVLVFRKSGGTHLIMNSPACPSARRALLTDSMRARADNDPRFLREHLGYLQGSLLQWSGNIEKS